MKELFPARDSLANKISYYHLLLFMASLPFDRFYSHLILISFTLHTLIQLNRQHIQPVFTWRTLLLESVFFITVLSTLYSINKPEGFNEWGKQITILLFPVVLCFNGLDLKKYRESLLLGFSLVLTGTIAYLYLTAFYTINYYNIPFLALFTTAFINHNFSEPIDMHATFLSMQVALALVYLFSIVIKERILFYKIFYAACIFILFAGLMQLCSKSVFFCLFVVINIAVPLFLLKNKARRNFILITASVSVIAIAGMLRSATFRERYITDLHADLTEEIMGESTESRLTRWQAVGELIEKAPVIGYGAGSELGLLQDTFFQKKYYDSFLHKLNAHSEYLSLLLKSGIVGLLVYLVTLTAGFKAALQRKDLLFFTFMLLVAVVSVSENVLDVDKGIIFYAFFFSFFVFTSDNHKEHLSHQNIT